MEVPTQSEEDLPTSGAPNASGAAGQTLDSDTIIISSIYALVCCVGVLGNSMVIYVVLRYAKMKTATNIYILNLAVADELFMASMPFLATSAALHHWPFGSVACRLVLSIDGINMFTSVFCLTVLSVDRYIAVVHPIKAATYRRLSVAKVINVLVWAFSLLVIVPIIVFADTQQTESGAVICNLLWPQKSWSKVFVVYTFLVGFLFPVSAICLCYLLIVVKMRAVSLKAGWLQRRKSEKMITWMVMLVVAVFAVCWTPFYTVQLVNVFWFQPDPTLTQLVVILSYANSGANPILYGFVSENFRQSFQRILCIRCSRGVVEERMDYRALALSAKAHVPDAAQPERPESGMVYPNGTCTSRTTAL
ncbi:somatostatin receptor type 1-like [Pristis pectinata]|uniref:somatostatin receptor type 1-like n=1 Tax=Pristis pectinata TaxID=685728 RepID=UPI00223E0866|nr:somatostatin receptor type 1-like [Pristis pectinata]XP_051901025.1 somatostatin receptor type 1-like [Pristis pectinata]